jgi:hypothetical protein
MKSEEIIMLIFVMAITILVPVFMYHANKEENK